MSALAEFRPERCVELALPKIHRNDFYLKDTPPAGDIGSLISRRYIGEGVLVGRFADLTKFRRDRVTDTDRDYTMQLSREIFELEDPRFDGLCYCSRITGIVRWAIFDRTVDDDGDWITKKISQAIDPSDPDLIRALRDCKVRSSQRASSSESAWTHFGEFFQE
jgi:hypothetical protein